jgi:hypothetical protein
MKSFTFAAGFAVAASGLNTAAEHDAMREKGQY